MNIEAEIAANHAKVSETALEFLNYATLEGNCLVRLHLLDDDLPRLLRTYKYPLHSWPWFVSHSLIKTLEECVGRIPDLILRALSLEFGRDYRRFQQFYSMPEVLAALVLSGGMSGRYLAQRTDAIMTANGLKILELNAGSSFGGWQIQWMDRQYRKQQSLSTFLETRQCHSRNIPLGFMEFLIRTTSEMGLTSNGEANALFVMTDHDADEFASLDGPAEIKGIYDAAIASAGLSGTLEFSSTFQGIQFDRDGVYYLGKKLACVMSPNVDQPPPTELFRASFSGQLLWTDTPLTSVFNDKRSLAILYQHRNSPAFNEAEKAAIEHFIPWSAPLRRGDVVFNGILQDMETMLLGNREKFVIKVANGARGENVLVGKYVSDIEWSTTVHQALRDELWVAQEYCRSLPYYGQLGECGHGLFDVVWGIFGFGNRYGGCWMRLMPRDSGKGVINSDKGAQEAIVYEVER